MKNIYKKIHKTVQKQQIQLKKRVKHLNRHSAKVVIWMADKPIKRYSTSLVV